MPTARRYRLEFAACLAAYAAMLALSIWAVGPDPEGPLDSLVLLLPMAPAAAMCWVVLRQLRRIDELQRRMQLEALAIAFAGTALLTFSYGFLEIAGWPRLSMFVVWPLMAVLWIVGGQIAARRFR